MLQKSYYESVSNEDFDITIDILQEGICGRVQDLIRVKNFCPAIAFLEAAQALKIASDQYDKAFRIMCGEK